MKCENKRQLTTVKVVLRKAERRSFYPPNFQSRREDGR